MLTTYVSARILFQRKHLSFWNIQKRVLKSFANWSVLWLIATNCKLQVKELRYFSWDGPTELIIREIQGLHLDLHLNQLCGLNPEGLSQLFQLETLYLDENQLNGAISKGLSLSLTKVERMLKMKNTNTEKKMIFIIKKKRKNVWSKKKLKSRKHRRTVSTQF